MGAGLGLILSATTALADPIRVATFAAPLSRDGPGLLLRDILKGDDPGIAAIAAVIAQTDPDILILTDFDYDAGQAALGAFADLLGQSGVPYPHSFAHAPNSVWMTDLDLDGDGRLGGAADRQGFGFFAGDNGMAVLSRLPIDAGASVDLSDVLWRDLPGATLPEDDFPSAEAQAVQRLSSSGHWIVRIAPPDGPPFDLLVFAATPPVFDGPEDLNGLRGRDELRLWTAVLDGAFGKAPDSFVIAGNSNLDPVDGDGFAGAMADFLSDPRLQDPAPQSAGAALVPDPDHRGDPAFDTADWPEGAPGNLRVSYVLPSVGWIVEGAGVFWPAPDDPAAALLGDDGLAAGPHRLVWVDLRRE
ncbi:endonuclease/exonuclease/phosphatase family protein [Marivivens marinus]|uniref:endonuclease/exonuclease/phosphatase family protein n=1 Tax=Marivivens marinus TaxID=3110173 RepID=UPI003B849DE1